MTLIDHARQFGLGRLALRFYHRPLNQLRDSLRNGGPLAERMTERHRRDMEEAAATFAALPTFAGAAPVQLHLMTGGRFWYQTVFCLHSFARAAKRTVHAELYDDGTIDERCAALLAGLGPTVRIHPQAALRAKLNTLMPKERFPMLHDRWEKYPNIRKLIDVHLGSTGWKLVIDSDLLFFRRPDALLQWCDAPQAILHAIDCVESYGYSKPLLERLAHARLPERLNVGVCGLCSEQIDWEKLEYWTAELQRHEKTSYYLEQALVALMGATEVKQALPETDYLTKPSSSEVSSPQAVMHHYVDTSKRWYFRTGWRHFASDCTT
jgi:hypothetical protein